MGDIVKISNNYDQNRYVTGASKIQRINMSEGKSAKETSEIKAKDTVSISKASKDIQLAKDAVGAAPDIRPEEVNPIKQKIAEGTYEINAEEIAERMIGMHISEWA